MPLSTQQPINHKAEMRALAKTPASHVRLSASPTFTDEPLRCVDRYLCVYVCVCVGRGEFVDGTGSQRTCRRCLVKDRKRKRRRAQEPSSDSETTQGKGRKKKERKETLCEALHDEAVVALDEHKAAEHRARALSLPPDTEITSFAIRAHALQKAASSASSESSERMKTVQQAAKTAKHSQKKRGEKGEVLIRFNAFL